MRMIFCLIIISLTSYCNKNDDTVYEECIERYYARISEVCNCYHTDCYVEHPISEAQYRQLLPETAEACSYVQIEVLDSQEIVEGYLAGVGKRVCY